MANAYFNRTGSTATNSQKATYSFWLKRGALATGQWIYTGGTTVSLVGFNGSSDSLSVLGSDSLGEGNITAAVFRDISAWYHVVIAIDTTQATTANRANIYVNGILQTVTVVNGGITLNSSWGFNTAGPLAIGRYSPVPASYFNGYLAQATFVDGSALPASSFGYTDANGVWQPKAYTGVYGTNGFYLPFNNFSTAAALGNDYSGNNNNWTVNNISVAADATYDPSNDGPTVNYATLNTLNKATQVTLTSGALIANLPANNWTVVPSTMAFGGKQYCEFTMVARNQSDVSGIGILIANQDVSQYFAAAGSRSYEWCWQGNTNSILNNNASVATGLPNFAVGDVISFAFDATAGNWWLAKNNVWVNSGNPATGANPTVTGLTNANGYVPAAFGYTASGTQTQWRFNAGQQAFAYTLPSGFSAMSTANLPTPTIVAPNTQMDATLYTGNGGSLTVTNTGGFAPDFVWFKSRSNAYSHGWFDRVRGATNKLSTDIPSAEVVSSGVNSFNTNGFTLGSDPGGNQAGSTYVGWQWRANGAAVTNTNGSRTSQVSANPTAGFSVVTYTGDGSGNFTVGHGLGVKPAMIIFKNRSTSTTWGVWHQNLSSPSTECIFLNTTARSDAAPTYWNSTEPTSTVFTIGTATNVRLYTAENIVAYCWAQMPGYSAFGSYTGNGSTDGPFVYCGFRPRWIMVKRTDGVNQWNIWDTARNTFNAAGNILIASSNASEDTVYLQDILSNGFKPRIGAGYAMNDSGGNYIYMAFAEAPFKYSLAR